MIFMKLCGECSSVYSESILIRPVEQTYGKSIIKPHEGTLRAFSGGPGIDLMLFHPMFTMRLGVFWWIKLNICCIRCMSAN